MDTTTEPTTLEFSRLDGSPGTLVAIATGGDRVVVAIVHPPRDGFVPWSLAGDIDRANRPQGQARRLVATAMAEAGQALGEELGITVAAVTLDGTVPKGLQS